MPLTSCYDDHDEASLCSSALGEDLPLGESLASLTIKPHHRKSVSFGDTVIRTHPVVLGDHPFCRSGCPLELSWIYDQETKVSVDDFESHREPRKPPSALRTTREERREMLLKTTPDREITRYNRKAMRRSSPKSGDLKEFFQAQS